MELPDDHDDHLESNKGEECDVEEDFSDDFQEPPSASCIASPSGSAYVDSPAVITSLNRYFAKVGETPFTRTKASQPHYLDKKMKEITESMKNLMIRSDAGHTENNDGREMIKDKFEVTTDRATQMQILTVLPQSWSAQKIQDEFSVTNYMARKSKELVKEKGILSIPNPKPGPSLSPETTDLIIRI